MKMTPERIQEIRRRLEESGYDGSCRVMLPEVYEDMDAALDTIEAQGKEIERRGDYLEAVVDECTGLGYPESTPNAVGQPVSLEPRPAQLVRHAISTLSRRAEKAEAERDALAAELDDLICNIVSEEDKGLTWDARAQKYKLLWEKLKAELTEARAQIEGLREGVTGLRDHLYDWAGNEMGVHNTDMAEGLSDAAGQAGKLLAPHRHEGDAMTPDHEPSCPRSQAWDHGEQVPCTCDPDPRTPLAELLEGVGIETTEDGWACLMCHEPYVGDECRPNCDCDVANARIMACPLPLPTLVELGEKWIVEHGNEGRYVHAILKVQGHEIRHPMSSDAAIWLMRCVLFATVEERANALCEAMPKVEAPDAK